MNYKCNSCSRTFKPATQFETNCVHCGSDDVSMDDSSWNFEKITRFFTKSPNKYFFVGVFLVILLLKMCSPNIKDSENVEYKLVKTEHPDYVQFSILQYIKDEEGKTIGQKDPITGKNVQDFAGGIFLVDDSGKILKINLVDGDKFFACEIPEHGYTFSFDVKRNYGDKIRNRTITWFPSKIHTPCPPNQIPPSLRYIVAKQVGGYVVIETNLDNIADHGPLFYSISGKNGDFVEGKSKWEICDLSEIEVWVTDETDTVLAAGSSPIVIDKSACPMTTQQLSMLVNSIQTAGNTFGSNICDANLLSNFENSFSVMVDSDGDGSLDKRIGASPMNIEFQIDSEKFTYQGFQSYTLSLVPPCKRYRCSVQSLNGRILKIIFQ
jgi:hypothetical protein